MLLTERVVQTTAGLPWVPLSIPIIVLLIPHLLLLVLVLPSHQVGHGRHLSVAKLPGTVDLGLGDDLLLHQLLAEVVVELGNLLLVGNLLGDHLGTLTVEQVAQMSDDAGSYL